MKKSRKYVVVLIFIFVSVSIALASEDEVAVARLIMKKSGITLTTVLEEVKKRYPESIIYEYELEEEDDLLFHEIKMVNLADNLIYKIDVDIQTGAIISEKTSSAVSWFGLGEKRKEVEKISKSGFQLVDAIAKIDLKEDMVIKEIEFEEKYGVQYFEIETYGPNGKSKWLVDLESRSLVPTFSK